MKDFEYKMLWAYVLGVAIGDGNLSNPNGRAVKLRVSCDTKYPKLIQKIKLSLEKFLPENKVSIIKRPGNCVDIFCHSNTLETLLGWKACGGPKHVQRVRVPLWVKEDNRFSVECLRGLLETDGSVYLDRGYKMVNFVTIIPELATDVFGIITKMGFKPHHYIVQDKMSLKHTVRLSRDVESFIQLIALVKE